jgi:hypothetical protein
VLSSSELSLLLLLELLIDPVSLAFASWISELSFSELELPSLLLPLLLSDGSVADRRVNSTIIFLPIDPVYALLSLLLSSGGSREKAAISSLGASLGVGSWSSWCSESS